jgi:hypothetical protein
MKKYEIMFKNGKIEVVDFDTMEDLIYELESFERDDVNMIDEVDDNGEFIKRLWTEEEGLFVNLY